MDKKSSENKKASPFSANDTIDTLANETKGLFEDLTGWMELKVQYILLDYQEQMTKKAKGIAFEIGAIAIVGLGFLFGLVALALGVGSWLNHPAWGFLAVMVLLILVALVVRAVGKRVSASEKSGRGVQDIDISETKPKLPGPRIPEQASTQNGKG